MARLCLAEANGLPLGQCGDCTTTASSLPQSDSQNAAKVAWAWARLPKWVMREAWKGNCLRACESIG